MKRLFTLALFALLCAGSAKAQRLLIRGDDIGGSHASNVGIITTFTEGIERTAEVMVVGPWFPEAVEHIGYENVSEDRESVINLWTSPKVKAYIEEHGIELVSFGDLLKEKNTNN